MRKALIVGLDHYPQYELECCVRDAKKLQQILEKHEDGAPNFDVNLRISSDEQKITKPQLRQAITKLFSADRDVEIALFYFAGHGHVTASGGTLVTPDYARFDEGVAMDEVLKLANQSNATNRIVILDCCYAGQIGNTDERTGKFTELASGVTILTSSNSTEVSDELDGHGVFTSLLIDALNGACADLVGNISPGAVYAYIDQALGAWGQRPIFKTNVSKFTSLRKVSAPIDAAILRKIPSYFSKPKNEFHLNPTFEFTHENHDTGNVAIFKDLQKLESVGLVKPVDEEHMYFAAMNNRSCKLTTMGIRYWKLAKEGRL